MESTYKKFPDFPPSCLASLGKLQDSFEGRKTKNPKVSWVLKGHNRQITGRCRKVALFRAHTYENTLRGK